MPRVDVKYSAMRTASAEFKQQAAEVQMIKDEMLRVISQLPLNTNYYKMAKLAITAQINNISNVKNSLERMSQALTDIDRLYVQGDSNAMNGLNGATVIGITNIADILHVPDGVLEYLTRLFPWGVSGSWSPSVIARFLPFLMFGAAIPGGAGITLLSGSLFRWIRNNGSYRDVESAFELLKGSTKGDKHGSGILGGLGRYNDELNDELKEEGSRYTSHYNSDMRKVEGTENEYVDRHGNHYTKYDDGNYVDKNGNKIDGDSLGFAQRDISIAAWQKSDKVSVLHDEASDSYGILGTSASYDVLTAKYEAGAGAGHYTYTDKNGKTHSAYGVYAEAGASASIFEGEMGSTIGWDNANIYTKVGTKVGSVKADVGVNCAMTSSGPQLYVGGSAEAVAAEVSGSVGVDVMGTKVGVTGTAKVGVGVEFNAGYKDGHFTLDAGASLGVGGSIKLDIDVSGTVEKVQENWDNICNTASNIGKNVEKGFNDTIDFVGKKADEFGKGVEKIWKGIWG